MVGVIMITPNPAQTQTPAAAMPAAPLTADSPEPAGGTLEWYQWRKLRAARIKRDAAKEEAKAKRRFRTKAAILVGTGIRKLITTDQRIKVLAGVSDSADKVIVTQFLEGLL